MSPGWDRRPFLETQNPKFVELCGDERKNTSASLFKKDGLYIVALRYMRTLLQMQNPKSGAENEAKKKILRIQ